MIAPTPHPSQRTPMKVFKVDILRLRYAVVLCRTMKLVAVFASCADACALRDAGPKGNNGQTLYVVVDRDEG